MSLEANKGVPYPALVNGLIMSIPHPLGSGKVRVATQVLP